VACKSCSSVDFAASISWEKKHLQNPATKTWDGQNTSKYYNQNGISTTDGRNFSNNRLDGTTKFHSSNEGMTLIASLIQSYYG